MPEYVERFFVQAAGRTRLRVEPRADKLWRVEHVPQRFRAPSLPAVRRFGPAEREYPKFTFRKEQQREDRHLDAELMSPGHPLFMAVMDVLDEQLIDAREAAAAFIDPSAREPYRVYFFEMQILSEVPSGPAGATSSVVSHAELAAVLEDADGRFEAAAPDLLLDLTPEAVEHPVEAPSTDDVRRAERWLQVKRTSPLVASRREERLREMQIRKEFLERSFHELVKARRNAWMGLAARVASGDEDAKLARDEAQRALEETERRRDQKLAELRHLQILRPGPARYLGCAVVTPVTDPAVAPFALSDPEVERVAMEVAMRYEEEHGWDPLDVSQFHDGSGFDVRSVRREGEDGLGVRRIEVKGRSGNDPTVVLTPNEWTQARRHGMTYWLYVVTGCETNMQTLHRVQDPAASVGRKVERLTVVKGYQVPGQAVLEAAEDDR